MMAYDWETIGGMMTDDDRDCCKDARAEQELSARAPSPDEIRRAKKALELAEQAETVAGERANRLAQKRRNAARALKELEQRADAQRCVGVVFFNANGKSTQEYTYLVPEGWFLPSVGDMVVVPQPYTSYSKGPQVVEVVSRGRRNYFGELRTLIGRVEKY
jgi:hypothetical protein